MVSECCDNPVCVIFPKCFFVIYESFAFVVLVVFWSYEDGGEYGEMVK